MKRELERYLNISDLKKYCPGCSHPLVARAVAEALAQMGQPSEQVILVTDIGCCGLADHYFRTHTVHTLHGRSTAVASGIAWAQKKRFPGKAPKVLVFIGDGGATIGISHLIEAARTSAPICVILHNNFLYGMTGGQSSSSTPLGWVTRSTPAGNSYPPISFFNLLRESGATYLARIFPTDRRLPDVIQKALNCGGFACIEVPELCTAYAVKWNRLTMKKLEEEMKKMGWEPQEFFQERHSPAKISQKEIRLEEIEIIGQPAVSRAFCILIGGSAGQGVQWASRQIAESAIQHGYRVSLKSEIPITVGTGYSITELIFSPRDILYTGISQPDAVFITSLPGWNRLRPRLSNLHSSHIVVDMSISEEEIEVLRRNDNFIQREDFQKCRKIHPVLHAFQTLLSSHRLFPSASGNVEQENGIRN